MSSKTQTIELDEAIVAALKEWADARGMTVPDLLAEFVRQERDPVQVDADQVAELDKRWAAIEGGQPTVPNEKVVRWLETWGTPAYKAWHEQ
jgi:predicted transcriptional regulator